MKKKKKTKDEARLFGAVYWRGTPQPSAKKQKNKQASKQTNTKKRTNEKDKQTYRETDRLTTDRQTPVHAGSPQGNVLNGSQTKPN